MSTQTNSANWRALHGGLILALMMLPMFVPGLTRWPLYLLAPLLVYLLLACILGPLRRTVAWLRLGRFDSRVIVATATIILVSTSALVAYEELFHPDLSSVAEQLPVRGPLPVYWACALFAIVNALLEEAIFRGIFLDALASQLGSWWAVFLQAVLFGIGHAHGYPPGIMGIVMASLYGLLLGLLRLRAQGLIAPFLAHICADATIFCIVATHAG